MSENSPGQAARDAYHGHPGSGLDDGLEDYGDLAVDERAAWEAAAQAAIATSQPGDAAIEAWIRRNPQAFKTWVRKQARIASAIPIAGASPIARRS